MLRKQQKLPVPIECPSANHGFKRHHTADLAGPDKALEALSMEILQMRSGSQGSIGSGTGPVRSTSQGSVGSGAGTATRNSTGSIASEGGRAGALPSSSLAAAGGLAVGQSRQAVPARQPMQDSGVPDDEPIAAVQPQKVGHASPDMEPVPAAGRTFNAAGEVLATGQPFRASSDHFRTSQIDRPDMVALISSMPLIARLGLLEASGAPGESDRFWQVSPLGRLFLLSNMGASALFFLVGSLLQQLWEPLRNGEIDSRAIVATMGAGLMILSFVNAVISSLKLLVALNDVMEAADA